MTSVFHTWTRGVASAGMAVLLLLPCRAVLAEGSGTSSEEAPPLILPNRPLTQPCGTGEPSGYCLRLGGGAATGESTPGAYDTTRFGIAVELSRFYRGKRLALQLRSATAFMISGGTYLDAEADLSTWFLFDEDTRVGLRAGGAWHRMSFDVNCDIGCQQGERVVGQKAPSWGLVASSIVDQERQTTGTVWIGSVGDGVSGDARVDAGALSVRLSFRTFRGIDTHSDERVGFTIFSALLYRTWELGR